MALDLTRIPGRRATSSRVTIPSIPAPTIASSMLGVGALAWAVVVLGTGFGGHVHTPSFVRSAAWWPVMVIAMMLPLVIPGAEQLARAGLRRRRRVAVLEFGLAYASVWTAVGLVMLSATHLLWPLGVPPWAPVVVALAAATWHPTSIRRDLVTRCRGTTFVEIDGWRADRDCLTGGVREALRCVGTCGPAMLVMVVTHSLIAMVWLTAVLVAERSPGPNPDQRAGRGIEAIALVGLAGLLAWWGLRGEGHLP